MSHNEQCFRRKVNRREINWDNDSKSESSEVAIGSLVNYDFFLFNWDTDIGDWNLEWMEFTCCVECTFHRKNERKKEERRKWQNDSKIEGQESHLSFLLLLLLLFVLLLTAKNRTFSSSFQFRENYSESELSPKKVWNDLLVEDWICFFLSLVSNIFYPQKNVRERERVKVIGSIHSPFSKSSSFFCCARVVKRIQAFWGWNCSFFSFRIQSFLFMNSCDSCADWTLIEKELFWEY